MVARYQPPSTGFSSMPPPQEPGTASAYSLEISGFETPEVGGIVAISTKDSTEGLAQLSEPVAQALGNARYLCRLGDYDAALDQVDIALNAASSNTEMLESILVSGRIFIDSGHLEPFKTLMNTFNSLAARSHLGTNFVERSHGLLVDAFALETNLHLEKESFWDAVQTLNKLETFLTGTYRGRDKEQLLRSTLEMGLECLLSCYRQTNDPRTIADLEQQIFQQSTRILECAIPMRRTREWLNTRTQAEFYVGLFKK